VRKDLLDDSNAAKDLMDDVKKRLKILLRPGEPEKRPELTWPKSMKKEPVEVVKVGGKLSTVWTYYNCVHALQEVIELLGTFRDIMRRKWETMDVDKIQERWYVASPHSLRRQTDVCPGVVETNLGSSGSAGRSCSKISATSNRKNSTLHASRSFTTRSSIARCITERSCSRSSASRATQMRSLKIAGYMNSSDMLKLSSTSSPLRNMVSSLRRSASLSCQSEFSADN
jgi:hypothetical protein